MGEATNNLSIPGLPLWGDTLGNTSVAPLELGFFAWRTHSLPLWGYAVGFTSVAPLELRNGMIFFNSMTLGCRPKARDSRIFFASFH